MLGRKKNHWKENSKKFLLSGEIRSSIADHLKMRDSKRIGLFIHYYSLEPLQNATDCTKTKATPVLRDNPIVSSLQCKALQQITILVLNE